MEIAVPESIFRELAEGGFRVRFRSSGNGQDYVLSFGSDKYGNPVVSGEWTNPLVQQRGGRQKSLREIVTRGLGGDEGASLDPPEQGYLEI